ncbi:MAG: hypothetical protein LBP30_02590 [Clostridiales Family XIII bacterium]|jgi:hypothetical protein|nr:hypothetical protein [Clostridiales Family XIII bacterium]
MRDELKPDYKTIKKLFPLILKILEGYSKNCEGNYDENTAQYKSMVKKLAKLTGKNIKEYCLSSWLDEDEIDIIAFVISIPKAHKIKNITKIELKEIINILFESIENGNILLTGNEEILFDKKYLEKLSVHYFGVLKTNYKNYSHLLFYQHLDENSNKVKYSKDEIVNILME